MSIKKSGIITLCGRPNVGKSTLTNALVGEKVAIVTNKPQTTRNRISAILNRGECQFVFVDTPGLHKARTRLGDYMVNVVKESVADVDAVMLLVEPIPNVGGPEAELIARLERGDRGARDLLIEHNLRLVAYIARRFENTGINIEDLISIGTIGLIKAVGTYQPAKSIKLATYASRCIENEILMYLRKTANQKTELSFDEP